MTGKLDFFVVGAQKAGTTALDAFLRWHPQIEMGLKKELHFFDDESVDWRLPNYTPLNAFYNWKRSGILRGEATPIYMYWPNSLERLQAYNRDARLVILLRHPAYRAYSHWRMEVTRGNENFRFGLAISDVGRLRVRAEPQNVHRVFSYVERGFYSSQILRVLRYFPACNVLFLRTDNLWRDPFNSLSLIAEFLGVDARGFQNVPQEYVTPIQPADPEPMAESERAYLNATYEADIEETANLSGLDLSEWLDPFYAEPMLTWLHPIRIGLAA